MQTIALHGGAVALVDDEDYEVLIQRKWYLNKAGYAVAPKYVVGSYSNGKYKTESSTMHGMIMGETPEPGLEVDHRNRNGLDNQKHNLRWATHQQNMMNCLPTSGYKGVTKDRTRWSAKIGDLYLGSFGTAEDAAKVYDKAARKLFPDFAYLNFPEEYWPDPVRFIDFQPEEKAPTSKYPGVSYFGHGGKRVKRWRAVYRKKQLGFFHTEQEAYQAYKEAKGES